MGEAKEFPRRETRRRLLEAALRVLAEDGEAGLTTTKVAQLAGRSQPSFYSHFASMDDLLDSLVDEVLPTWIVETVAARARSRTGQDEEDFRDTYRIPMHAAIERPDVFRLLLKHRFDETSAVGRWSQQVFDALRTDLVLDLEAAGFSLRSAKGRRQAEMIADGIIALTNEMILGHLDGRYPDIEEAIDVLIAFSRGYLVLRPGPGLGAP